MLISDIPEPVKQHCQHVAYTGSGNDDYEPMDPALVLEQSESDTVYGGIAPTLVEETASSIEMVKVVFVCLAPPEVHIANLKVAPEVAR